MWLLVFGVLVGHGSAYTSKWSPAALSAAPQVDIHRGLNRWGERLTPGV